MRGFSNRLKINLASNVLAALAVTVWTSAALSDSHPSNQIRDVQIEKKGDATTVTVIGSLRPNFTAFKLTTPKRLVIDIPNSKIRGVPSVIQTSTDVVSGVAVSEYSVNRVMINFSKDAAYRVRVSGNKLIASLSGSPGRLGPEKQGPASSEDAIREARANAEKAIEKVRTEAEDAIEKARAEARRADDLHLEAVGQLERLKRENKERSIEAEKAKREADEALARLEKAKAAHLKKEELNQTRLSRQAIETMTEIEKYRKSANEADALAKKEREKRLEAEEKLASLNKQLESAAQVENRAKLELEKASKEAVTLKKEAKVLAEAAASASKEAEAALVAQLSAAGEYKKASESKREELLRVLKQKEREAIEAKQKLTQTKEEQQLTLEKLGESIRKLDKATSEAQKATSEQQRIQKLANRELASAKKRIEQAEKAAAAAGNKAEKARADKDRAEQEVERIRRDAEQQRLALKKQADDRLAEALNKLRAAEEAQQRSNERLLATEKIVRESEAEAVRAGKQAREFAAQITEERKKAQTAEKRADEFAKELAQTHEKASLAKKEIEKFADELASAREKKKLAEAQAREYANELNKAQEKKRNLELQADRFASELAKAQKNGSRTEEEARNLASELAKARENEKRAEQHARAVEKDLTESKSTIENQEKKISEMMQSKADWVEKEEAYKKKLSQEELRVKRLAEMRSEKIIAKTEDPARAPQTLEKPLIKDIEFVTDGEFQKIVIKTEGRLPYSTTTGDKGNATIVFRGAAIAPILERTLDVTDFGGVVGSVSSYRERDEVRIDVAVEQAAVNSIERRDGAVEWIFAPKVIKPKPTESFTGPKGTMARTIPSANGNAYAYPVERTAGYTVGMSSNAKRKRHYTGRHIDLDFKNADLHNILRLLADVGQVNIITADDVSGSVTIRMRDVAWDHALDVILQAKQLGMEREGNLIRVAPMATLEKEQEMEIARREQQMKLEPLETRLIPISYATADELKTQAKDLTTDRGTLSVDKRTNVIIARDTRGALDQIEALVRNLDTQTPQVLIESRIVEATSTFAREIGIQWGGDFQASEATGNPTGLAFPSSFGIAGGATDGQTPTTGLSTAVGGQPNPNFAVNMPAPAGTDTGGALGITLGSITNNANLALRLSAMEEEGTLRILSSPKILTLDNRSATIEQGTSIPFSQVSSAGVNTSFKEAKLSLNVTPHVTAEGSVMLQVSVTRDEPDFNNTGARGDPTILKRSAQTELLVSDGHTAVIGGIFTRNYSTGYKKVPFLADIPILGWLFKTRSQSDRRGEILIFITPRIVNRAESIGQ
jgi:type IV pilus assembly protein PilQ